MVQRDRQVDENFVPPTAKKILDGDISVEEASRDITKADLESLNKDETIVEDLLESGSEYLENLGIEIDPNDVDIIIVETAEDIDHLDPNLETDQRGAYSHINEELFLFTDPSGEGASSMGYSKIDPLVTVAHELKHRDQHLKFEESMMENYSVKEAATQLINFYREDILEDKAKLSEEINSLRSDDNYPRAENLAEETELAANCYNNLRLQGLEPEEAMEFMLNEYEDRRIEYVD